MLTSLIPNLCFLVLIFLSVLHLLLFNLLNIYYKPGYFYVSNQHCSLPSLLEARTNGNKQTHPTLRILHHLLSIARQLGEFQPILINTHGILFQGEELPYLCFL